MHAEIRAVRAKLLGGDGKINGLQQCAGGRACLRMRRRRPVAEGEKTVFLRGGGDSLATRHPGYACYSCCVHFLPRFLGILLRCNLEVASPYEFQTIS